MLLLGILTSSLIIGSSCGDELAHPYRYGLPFDELKTFLQFPEKIEGQAALVKKGQDVRVYATVDYSGKYYQSLQIWGPDRAPKLLAKIEIRPLRRDVESGIEIRDEEGLALALQSLPSFEKYFIERHLLRDFGAAELDRIRRERTLEAWTGNSNEGYKSWENIFHGVYLDAVQWVQKHRSVYGIYSERELRGPTKERITIDFVDWFPKSAKALAAMDRFETPEGGGLGLRVYLNQRYKRDEPVDRLGFPSLRHRIQWGEGFSTKWLGVENPIVIEVRRKKAEEAKWIVYERKEDLPQSIEFSILDPRTSLQRELLGLPAPPAKSGGMEISSEEPAPPPP